MKNSDLFLNRFRRVSVLKGSKENKPHCEIEMRTSDAAKMIRGM